MLAYLAVLQILGIMLAVQTRRVKVKSLKDSAFVTANVYISSIVIVVFIIVTFVLRAYANTFSAILSFGTLLMTTAFLALTFIPKVLSIDIHHPHTSIGKNCFHFTFSRFRD